MQIFSLYMGKGVHGKFLNMSLKKKQFRSSPATAEAARLAEDAARIRNWKRWGPYLSERQWATVREDYSPDGSSWESFPFEHAARRAYRWGEDGLLGLTDRECRLCFAVALWNGTDPLLKERLFGLTNPEGRHGEDVKEVYFYLDSTPTHSYMKALYRYPQALFPYEQLRDQERRRMPSDPEFELAETGVFDDGRYFDITAEYAKAGPDDILIRLTARNNGPDDALLHVLPTLWFRNTWTWACTHEGCSLKPRISRAGPNRVMAAHETLGAFALTFEPSPQGPDPELLFTDNETNAEALYGSPNESPWAKDAFHERVVRGNAGAVPPRGFGTKCAAWYRLVIPPGGSASMRLRLAEGGGSGVGGASFDAVFDRRIREADAFYAGLIPASLDAEAGQIARQAYAGLLWSKQFYHYIVRDWQAGDPGMPPPPPGRQRNVQWGHLYSRDVLSVPDKWEYPWFAAWDLAFHMIPFARLDPRFAKDQLLLLLREWYMHPNGQIPAYEYAFSDVNPPVHAWAAWRVYKISAKAGGRDREFLESIFQKLLLNFTWWVNRKDREGRNLFEGGFLGLDNIGVFDRSRPLPMGGRLCQADATAWMGFYSLTMMAMAMELAVDGARTCTAYGDMASKFFEHFIQISDAINTLGGRGLWDEEDGFYYDQILMDSGEAPFMKVRSLVGLLPLVAVTVLEQDQIDRVPGFKKRFEWFLKYRGDLASRISFTKAGCRKDQDRWLLAIPSKERLVRLLRPMLDEREFLSPHGIRSLSKRHAAEPFVFRSDNREYRVSYIPGEGSPEQFGGNSNWRGPVWFPVNYLIIEALEQYHHYYGNSFKVDYPAGSNTWVTLHQVADDLYRRLAALFRADSRGHRPYLGPNGGPASPAEPFLFHEYFDGDTGRGLGASHQTGWTALVTRCLESVAGPG
jgi:hypothetical protein